MYQLFLTDRNNERRAISRKFWTFFGAFNEMVSEGWSCGWHPCVDRLDDLCPLYYCSSQRMIELRKVDYAGRVIG